MAEGPSAPGAAPAFQQLLKVQDLDTALTQLRHRRQHLEERRQLEEVDRRHHELEAEAAPLRRDLEALARRQGEIEAQVAAAEERRAVLEARLYAPATALRDLEAMAGEVDHLKVRRRHLEDEELEVMERQEELERALAPLAEEQQDVEERRRTLAAALADAEAEVAREEAALVPQREAEAKELPDDLAVRYERLRARLGGTGAARLAGDRCDGCHLSLPSMELERIRHLPPEAVVTCEHCGRILVRPPCSS